MSDLMKRINESVAYLQEKLPGIPQVGIVLGTGLGGLADKMEGTVEIPYGDIPYFPVSTVESHKGSVLYGELFGLKVLMFQGRFHFYEGYSMQELAFPLRAFKMLGGSHLFLSSAVGGLNPNFKRGTVVLNKDHINLMGDNPLIGENNEKLGPRFPDMSEPYSRDLMELAMEAAMEENVYIQKGVLSAMTGPCLETAAEYRFLRLIGADTIGMSTVPEVIAGVHCGLKILAMSIVTDECLPDALKPAKLEEIIAVAEKAEPKLAAVFMGVLKKLSKTLA